MTTPRTIKAPTRFTQCVAGLAIAIAAAATPGLAEEGFHPARTAPEIALNRILRRADADHVLLDNLFKRYGPVPRARRVDYSAFLTPELLAALASTEAKMVKENCGGQYRDGEICGLDYSPITCAQDYAKPYSYRTESSGPGRAAIAYRWPHRHDIAARYDLKIDAGVWKIDNISCGADGNFHAR